MFLASMVLLVVVVLGGYGTLMWKTSRRESLFDNGGWSESNDFHDWRRWRKQK